MFPGQGAEHPGMGSVLAGADPVFREALAECAAHWAPHHAGGWPALLADPVALARPDVAQQAVFAVGYALAQSWLARGLRPAALIGHGVGEYVAAVIAGVLSLGDAATLVAARGALAERLPAGAMLAVALDAAALEGRLPVGLSLAAANAPNAQVVAGAAERIDAWQSELEAAGVACRRLEFARSVDREAMLAVHGPFADALDRVALSAPTVPLISTVTGRRLTADEAQSARHWLRHLHEPVLFSQAVRSALADDPQTVFLEVGPRNALAALVRQHRGATAVSSLGHAPATEATSLALAQARLWTYGHETLSAAPGSRRRVPLPTYPFERRRCWIDAPAARPEAAVPPPADASTSLH